MTRVQIVSFHGKIEFLLKYFRVLSWGCKVHGLCKARVQNLSTAEFQKEVQLLQNTTNTAKLP